MIRPSLQSAFQFIPKVFNGVEVRALCRSVTFFHNDLSKSFLYGSHFVHGSRKGPSPNCCHKVGSTELSRMSLHAVALRFPFTGTKGLSPNHEKQPQTIIPHPPNFTVGTMHWGRYHSPGICQTQIRLSDCQMVKRDLSLQRTHFHCSRVQWRRALHQCSRRLALCMVILGLCAAARPWKPIS